MQRVRIRTIAVVLLSMYTYLNFALGAQLNAKYGSPGNPSTLSSRSRQHHLPRHYIRANDRHGGTYVSEL